MKVNQIDPGIEGAWETGYTFLHLWAKGEDRVDVAGIMAGWLSHSPRALEWLELRAQSLEQRGWLRASEWLLARVALGQPPQARRWYQLARLQDSRGRLPEARRSYAQALELKPDFYLCRVGFFELCRQDYWTFQPTLLTALEGASLEEDGQKEALLRRYHLLLADALDRAVLEELARADDPELEVPVLERIQLGTHERHLAMRERLRREASLEKTLRRLDEAELLHTTLEAQAHHARTQWARVVRRKRSPLVIQGLRDSDDRVGYALELISGGKLAFVGFDKLHRIQLGQVSDFTEATVELAAGEGLECVVPSTYYGSRISASREIQRGELTLFKQLRPWLKLGAGRRVFVGTLAETGDPVVVAFHEVLSIEFFSEAPA